MKCNEAQNLMMQYIEGKLPAGKVPQFKAHIEVCPLCREAYADEVEMIAAFTTDVPGIAGLGFVEEVMDRVMISTKTSTTRATVVRVNKWVTAVSVAALIILGSVFWFNKPAFISLTQGYTDYGHFAVEAVNNSLDSIVPLYEGFITSGESIYTNATSSMRAFGSSYLTVIGITTAIALAVCIGLVGAFRGKIAEELSL